MHESGQVCTSILISLMLYLFFLGCYTQCCYINVTFANMVMGILNATCTILLQRTRCTVCSYLVPGTLWDNSPWNLANTVNYVESTDLNILLTFCRNKDQVKIAGFLSVPRITKTMAGAESFPTNPPGDAVSVATSRLKTFPFVSTSFFLCYCVGLLGGMEVGECPKNTEFC